MSKFPIYLQHDAMQCGVACLRMVCAHFGQQFSMEELSELCSTASAEGKVSPEYFFRAIILTMTTRRSRFNNNDAC